MTDEILTISRLMQFKNAGVWDSFSNPQNKISFGKRNLIFGFNGSGKTTLSRTFSSLEVRELEGKLPENCDFTFEFSNSEKCTATNLSHPLKNNILVFNDDFVERNLLWNEGSANPIFYISKDSVDAVKQLEVVELELRTEDAKLIGLKAEEAKANSDFGKFKTTKATRVRELANVAKLSQAFTKTHLEKEYAKTDFDQSDLQSEQNVETLKEIVNQSSPLPKIDFQLDISAELFETIQNAANLLSKTPSAILTAGMEANIDAMEWIGAGHSIHTKKGLNSCLFCENVISQARIEYFSNLFDTTWQETTDAIQASEDLVRDEHKRLRELYPNIPNAELFQPEHRGEYEELLTDIQLIIKDVGLSLISVADALTAKRGQLSKIRKHQRFG